MSLSKIAADSLAATNRAGSGPSANQLQMEAFSQQSRDEWHLMMEKTRGEARGSERISLREKYCYKTYLTAPWDPTWSQKEKKKCNWVKEVFFVEDGELKRKPTKRHPVARVVKHEAECFEAIVATHLSLNHAGQDATTHAVLKDFYGISKQEVLSLVKHCSICARSRPSKAKGPLQPIQSKRVFERVQIDLIDMGSDPDGQYLWIAHMVDHFSKFHFMYAMPNKESSTVARVVHHWICTFGNMEILQSDNGTEFKGVCEEILLRYGVQVINGRPRTPRTQGLVEQANGTVKKRITAWKRQTGNPFWHEALEVRSIS